MSSSSYVAWLDHSERDRRRALDAVQALREQSTIDELGLGVVWEPIADLLFPGTSTIQTRARYFLIVPWVYRDIERMPTRPSSVAVSARVAELGLIKPLVAAEDSSGVIGRQAGRSLKRLPSEIYWRGLESWGIRTFHGSRDQYHRWLTARSKTAPSREYDDDPGVRSAWHPGLPSRPEDFPQPSGLQLAELEAAFLQDRIQQRQPGSLLAWLVGHGHTTDVLFPWRHPQLGDLPGILREQLAHARAFSLVIHGAQLLYNLMLAEALELGELAGIYRDELESWGASLEAASHDLDAWNVDDFWRFAGGIGVRASIPTRAFIDRWVDLALRGGAGAAGDEAARELIKDREARMKGSRARLTNRSALQRWNGASGTGRIDYRWSTAQVIVNDILRGVHDGA